MFKQLKDDMPSLQEHKSELNDEVNPIYENRTQQRDRFAEEKLIKLRPEMKDSITQLESFTNMQKQILRKSIQKTWY